VVNGAVSGFGFTNVKVSGANSAFTCLNPNTTNVTCTLTNNGVNNAPLAADIQFVTSTGTTVVYATDQATQVTWGAGKNVTLNQSIGVPAAATGTTGSALSGSKTGSNSVVIAVRLTDAGVTYNATLTLN
jgi:hypothetical protein